MEVFLFFVQSWDEKKNKNKDSTVTIIWDLQSSAKWAQASHIDAKAVAGSQAAQPVLAVLPLPSTEGPLDL